MGSFHFKEIGAAEGVFALRRHGHFYFACHVAFAANDEEFAGVGGVLINVFDAVFRCRVDDGRGCEQRADGGDSGSGGDFAVERCVFPGRRRKNPSVPRSVI